MGADPIVDAIDAMRSQAKGRVLEQALATIYDWLDAHYGRKPSHAEHRQVTVIKVFRAAPRCQATERKPAEAWLHRIYQNVLRDSFRSRKSDPLAQGTGEDPSVVLDRIEHHASEAKHDDSALDAHEEWFFDEVDAWLDDTIAKPGPRQKARTQAEVAWERHVREQKPAQIAEGLPNAPSTAALYKWIERGREKVLLPVTEALLTRELDAGRRGFCEALKELLENVRRADAGKARPERRVSSASADTSVQHGGAEPDSPKTRGSHD